MQEKRKTNKCVIDMAIVTKAIRHFSESDRENVYDWLKEPLMVTTFIELSSENTRRAIPLLMRNRALTWSTNFTIAYGFEFSLDFLLVIMRERVFT